MIDKYRLFVQLHCFRKFVPSQFWSRISVYCPAVTCSVKKQLIRKWQFRVLTPLLLAVSVEWGRVGVGIAFDQNCSSFILQKFRRTDETRLLDTGSDTLITTPSPTDRDATMFREHRFPTSWSQRRAQPIGTPRGQQMSAGVNPARSEPHPAMLNSASGVLQPNPVYSWKLGITVERPDPVFGYPDRSPRPVSSRDSSQHSPFGPDALGRRLKSI